MRRLPDGEWLFPLHHIAGSCCLFWPCVLRKVGQPATTFFEPDAEARSVVIEPILSLTSWEGWRLTWRSPAWQWQHAPPLRSEAAALRAIAEGSPQPFLSLASEAGFWTLGKDVLDKLAEHLGAGAVSAEDLFNSLTNVIAAVNPSISEDRLDLIAEQRLARMRHECASCVEELIELDEGVHMLDKDDERDIRDQVKDRKHKADVIQEFESSFGRERQKRGGSQNRKKASSAYKGPKKLPAGFIEHSVGKSLCPPDSFVWRGLKQGLWAGHYPPNPRSSYSWRLYSERGSLVRVLQDLWGHWCVAHGVSRSDVPSKSLWTNDGPDIGSVGGGASASSR